MISGNLNNSANAGSAYLNVNNTLGNGNWNISARYWLKLAKNLFKVMQRAAMRYRQHGGTTAEAGNTIEPNPRAGDRLRGWAAVAVCRG